MIDGLTLYFEVSKANVGSAQGSIIKESHLSFTTDKNPKTKNKQQSPTSKSPKQWANQKTQQLKHGLRPTPPSRTNRGKHAETRVEFSERKRHVSTSNNKRRHASRNQAPPPNMTEQPRETPDHAGIRTTTQNSTRTLTRATESISNDLITPEENKQDQPKHLIL
ncbi:hypothetical protein YC2023_080764 [Brassica napus]